MKSEVIVVTERKRLIHLMSTAGWNIFSDAQAKEQIADYLLANGVHVTACATCEYIKHLKDEGRIIELMGKPIKYCPECGEELR